MNDRVNNSEADFELQEIIGSGGMGIVYRARQSTLNRDIAVKQLHCRLPGSDKLSHELRARFKREIEVLAQVDHPHLVDIYSSGVSEDGRLYYSMNLVEGCNLSQLLKVLATRCDRAERRSFREWIRGDQPQGASPGLSDTEEGTGASALRLMEHTEVTTRVLLSSPRTKSLLISDESSDIEGSSDEVELLPQAQASPGHPVDVPKAFVDNSGTEYVRHVVEIVRQVGSAVAALHEADIVHRDIKPGNIMISRDGRHATLMDLGLAALLGNRGVRLTQTGQLMGAMPYIAPEQFSGGHASPQSDVYNLGVILWELLTRQRFIGTDSAPSDAVRIDRILHDEPDSIRRYGPAVSRDLEAVVLKCLEKKPGDRYESVTALLDDLARAMQKQPVTARRRGRLRSLFRHRSARRVLMWGAGLVACQLIIASAVAWAIIDRSATLEQPIDPTDLVPTDQARVIRDESLFAYWSGEGTGTNVTGSSQNRHVGSFNGQVIRTVGVVGKAWQFGGRDEYITFGSDPKWNFLHDGSPFTVSCFVTCRNSSRGTIISTIDAVSTSPAWHGFQLSITNKKLDLRIQGYNGPPVFSVQTPIAVPSEDFIPVAVSFDGEQIRLYINGIEGPLLSNGVPMEKATPQASFCPDDTTDALTIGSTGSGSGPNPQAFEVFDGEVDEVQIYKRALTGDEIRYLAIVGPDNE